MRKDLTKSESEAIKVAYQFAAFLGRELKIACIKPMSIDEDNSGAQYRCVYMEQEDGYYICVYLVWDGKSVQDWHAWEIGSCQIKAGKAVPESVMYATSNTGFTRADGTTDWNYRFVRSEKPYLERDDVRKMLQEGLFTVDNKPVLASA